MTASFDDAVAELYQAPHGEFVDTRKRLAGELKAAGDKTGATRLGKLPRPPISTWTVNQLWWHARDAFEAMLETAERLRDGDLSATAAHRDTQAKLRARASSILSEAGHAATESTLRRVMTTLSAIAANGGFDPDPPGTLSADRDPPGFEAAGISAPPREAPAPVAKAATEAKDKDRDKDEEDTDARSTKAAAEDQRRRDAEAKRAEAEAAAERRKAEQAEARRVAERHRIEAALRTAKGDVERRMKDVERLRDAVDKAEAAVDKARAVVEDLEAKLAEV
jgi:hypothetical protein